MIKDELYTSVFLIDVSRVITEIAFVKNYSVPMIVLIAISILSFSHSFSCLVSFPPLPFCDNMADVSVIIGSGSLQ